ncbi:hypothetical protein OG943_33120 [Amycolatopsis sp. NBC_00345]|uniref:hypothetical protein n=1 Tax=Amycolatopsis sp. NBC_00345 TaxID=2975955 RepID=UPI002E2672B6
MHHNSFRRRVATGRLGIATLPTLAGGVEEFRLPLPGDNQLVGYSVPGATPEGKAEVQYLHHGKLVADTLVPSQFGTEGLALTGGLCDAAGRTCVVGYDQGAHSSGVTGLSLQPGQGITVGTAVGGDAPGATLHRYGGTAGAALLDSTYDPDYATGPHYWQTYRTVGGQLVSTGCTTPSTSPTPSPAVPVTGVCPTL